MEDVRLHDQVMIRRPLAHSRWANAVGIVERIEYTFNGERTVRVKWSETEREIYDLFDVIKVDLPEDRSPAAVERWLASDEAETP